MTLRLILTRHAKSDWGTPGLSDRDRTLNDRGRRDAPAIGRWLVAQGITPGEVLCSSATRTAETAAAVLAEMPAAPIVTLRPPLYLADPGTLLGELRRATTPVVLMIAHNPGIAGFAHAMVAVHPDHPRWGDFPTAATAILDFPVDAWAELRPGTGKVAAFTTPHDIQ